MKAIVLALLATALLIQVGLSSTVEARHQMQASMEAKGKSWKAKLDRRHADCSKRSSWTTHKHGDTYVRICG